MKYLLNVFMFLCLVGTLVTMHSCDDDPIVQEEIVTVYDTLIVTEYDTLILNGFDTIAVTEYDTLTVNQFDTIFISETDTLFIQEMENVTNFVIVKHAEKLPEGNNPELTEAGYELAEELARILSNIELNGIYSTWYQRTMLTVTPTAEDQGLPITTYGVFNEELLVDEILENLSESTMLMVGHSNTVHNFLNALTGTNDYPELEEDVFDNLYLVRTKSKGDSEVIHLKY